LPQGGSLTGRPGGRVLRPALRDSQRSRRDGSRGLLRRDGPGDSERLGRRGLARPSVRASRSPAPRHGPGASPKSILCPSPMHSLGPSRNHDPRGDLSPDHRRVRCLSRGNPLLQSKAGQETRPPVPSDRSCGTPALKMTNHCRYSCAPVQKPSVARANLSLSGRHQYACSRYQSTVSFIPSERDTLGRQSNSFSMRALSRAYRKS